MDKSQEMMQQLINELGCVAEACRIYHRQLLNQGFTRTEAMSLIKDFQIRLLFNNNKEDN